MLDMGCIMKWILKVKLMEMVNKEWLVVFNHLFLGVMELLFISGWGEMMSHICGVTMIFINVLLVLNKVEI